MSNRSTPMVEHRADPGFPCSRRRDVHRLIPQVGEARGYKVTPQGTDSGDV